VGAGGLSECVGCCEGAGGSRECVCCCEGAVDDTRGGLRDRTGRGETGPGERGGMDAWGGDRVHRMGGGRRHDATARHSRYHTENRGYRAARSSNQRASSDRVEPFRGTSSVYIHLAYHLAFWSLHLR
jgi:hypothetical protein